MTPARYYDNRAPEENESYLRDRIAAQKRRIAELESENAILRARLAVDAISSVGAGEVSSECATGNVEGNSHE